MKKQRERCPECDVEMNRHAEKIVRHEDGEEDSVEVHTCPACGKTHVKKAE